MAKLVVKTHAQSTKKKINKLFERYISSIRKRITYSHVLWLYRKQNRAVGCRERRRETIYL